MTGLVSVVMAVHNGEAHLRESLDSVLQQTLPAFEVIVVDDGSTDGGARILEEYAEEDDRIKVLRQENRGIAASVNRGCAMAKGKYIARIDQDDVAAPQRFQRQVEAMEDNPAIGALGSALTLIDEEGRSITTWRFPTDPDQVSDYLLKKGNCVPQQTVMMRTEAFRALPVGYRAFFLYAEEYDLWLRMRERFPLANLAEPLMSWRLHFGSASNRNWWQGRLSTLSASALAERRAHGRSEPLLDWDQAVTPETAALLGVTPQGLREDVVGDYLSHADMMMSAGRPDLADRFLDEAIASANGALSRRLQGDLYWARARTHRRMGRQSRAAVAAMRAVAHRPALAARLLGRLRDRLGSAVVALSLPELVDVDWSPLRLVDWWRT